MPFVSDAQRRWGHTAAGKKALGGASKVAEWDQATKGKVLPERVPAHAEGGSVADKSWHNNAEFAKGGAELPRTGDWKKTVPNRGFLDSPDRFTGKRNVAAGAPKSEETQENWEKGSSKENPKGADKSEKPIKPRG